MKVTNLLFISIVCAGCSVETENEFCPDADADGVCDAVDACAGGDDGVDADSDGIPDDCDPCPYGNLDDSDGDGVCDSSDICPSGDDAVDNDGDSVPDACDICPGSDDAIDTDADGVPDGCDACAGRDDRLDADDDTIPDGCDTWLAQDIEDLDLTNFPSSTNVPDPTCVFRAKSYTFCAASDLCVYFVNNVGGKHSGESPYYDGATLATPTHMQFDIGRGPASQCNNPAVDISAGEYITVTFDGGQTLDVYLPAFNGVDLSLYIARDGSTYYDVALTNMAQVSP